jgi:hypothetical protein
MAPADNSKTGFNIPCTRFLTVTLVHASSFQSAMLLNGTERPTFEAKHEYSILNRLLYMEDYIHIGTRSRVVVKVLCYKPEGRGFEARSGECIFSIYLILPAALGPGVHSASNRNEYQKQKNNVSGQ